MTSRTALIDGTASNAWLPFDNEFQRQNPVTISERQKLRPYKDSVLGRFSDLLIFADKIHIPLNDSPDRPADWIALPQFLRSAREVFGSDVISIQPLKLVPYEYNGDEEAKRRIERFVDRTRGDFEGVVAWYKTNDSAEVAAQHRLVRGDFTVINDEIISDDLKKLAYIGHDQLLYLFDVSAKYQQYGSIPHGAYVSHPLREQYGSVLLGDRDIPADKNYFKSRPVTFADLGVGLHSLFEDERYIFEKLASVRRLCHEQRFFLSDAGAEIYDSKTISDQIEMISDRLDLPRGLKADLLLDGAAFLAGAAFISKPLPAMLEAGGRFVRDRLPFSIPQHSVDSLTALVSAASGGQVGVSLLRTVCKYIPQVNYYGSVIGIVPGHYFPKFLGRPIRRYLSDALMRVHITRAERT